MGHPHLVKNRREVTHKISEKMNFYRMVAGILQKYKRRQVPDNQAVIQMT